MQILFVLLIVAGLIICFGGIYIQKFCSALTGFINGAILTLIFIFIVFGLFRVARDESLYIMLFVGIVCAILSVVQEKLCSFINGFIPSFIVVSIILMFVSYSEDLEGTLIVVLAIVAGFIVGGISVSIHNYSYMLETAFTGAFMASIGVCGLVDESSDLVDIVILVARSEDYIGGILAGTIILGIIGFIVQLHRFNVIKSKSINKAKSDANQGTFNSWICECGNANAEQEIFCNQCGKKRMNYSQTPLSNEWRCSCGTSNPTDYLYCLNCGKQKNANNQDLMFWMCECGSKQAIENIYCSECGKKRGGKL